VQRDLGLPPQLVRRQDDMRVDHVVEVAPDAADLLLDIAAQRRGDVKVMAGNAQIH
jgi:hypothetical protein